MTVVMPGVADSARVAHGEDDVLDDSTAQDHVATADVAVAGSSTLRVEITAVTEDVPVFRAALRAWLTARHLLDRRGEDILLAVDEAVANSVEHAYRGTAPGPVVLTALTLGAATVRISVADRGQWLTPTPDDNAVPLRGRGLSIIRAVADIVSIDRGTPTAPGTTTTAEFTGR
ncbi:ATP-binding protein [Actinokineospora terrae]|uniref:Anti-sigma regulatory factor (Ser/Thr protein kinase) n=1 Tax=Actinokineospora terrae TaxID=155974 RepID=A0A1H9MRI0_9PSEU|nr:ATP-binding protein [Actinokineospora terrae]SER25733.1 Anti-sigma regulatory factor (Ser/Thr protein kinase) [Actinokineospora terrae]